MNLMIELPDELGASLEAHAQAKGLSTDRYISRVLEDTLTSEGPIKAANQPFETGYGTWAKFGLAPSAEEIDENRREMFQNFARDF